MHFGGRLMRYVVGISGASGIILAYKTIEALVAQDHEVELIITKNAAYAASLENTPFDPWLKSLDPAFLKKIKQYSNQDIGCALASGSYVTDGMIIIPCSMATVAAVAMGLSDNALRRAADVTIKERRDLIVVPRESPFSEIHLENLLRLAKMGVTILPPVPAWYTHPKGVSDIENFIVGKVLDVLKIPHTLYPRWG
jgi:polyprenyl P-hydroxybenzoate/phenylacrylic acid decarboxylase-like protein